MTGTADLADFIWRVPSPTWCMATNMVGDGPNLRLGLQAGYPPSARVSLKFKVEVALRES